MRSLRGRLTLGITLVLAVVLAGAGVIVSRYVDRSERAALDDRLERTAELSRDTRGGRAAGRACRRTTSAWTTSCRRRGLTLRLIVGPIGDPRVRQAPAVGRDPAHRTGCGRSGRRAARTARSSRACRRAGLGGLGALRGDQPAYAGRAQRGVAQPPARGLRRRRAAARRLRARGSPPRCCWRRCAACARATSTHRRHRGPRPARARRRRRPPSCARWPRASTTCSRGSGARRPTASARWRRRGASPPTPATSCARR